MPLNKRQMAFVIAARQMFGANMRSITRAQILKVEMTHDMSRPHWLLNGEEYRLGRGVYKLPPSPPAPASDAVVNMQPTSEPEPMTPTPPPTPETPNLSAQPGGVSLVPDKDPNYVPFGAYNKIRDIIKSGIFYTVYITGLSGNGKTLMVDQACHELGREMVRVNCTAETDEDDLLGGFRLVDGKTVWHDGPVVLAMQRGAVLLLDEVDLASIKIMCLQPVLEGKSIYLKKINRVVKPVKGFNVIATANTKGKGSADGRFVGTNVMNEAFLERFAITIEQEYPPMSTEERILTNVFRSMNIDAKEFVKLLVKWADVTRKTYAEDGCSEVISTRRLVHIANAYSIFKNKREAIDLCLARFDGDTKKAFSELYSMVDDEINSDTGSMGRGGSSLTEDEMLDAIAPGKGGKAPF